MKRIVVGLLALPKMLHEIVSRAILEAPELDCIELSHSDVDPEQGDHAGIDVLAVSVDQDEGRSLSQQWLMRHPESTVLVFDDMATNCHLYELKLHAQCLPELSAELLVSKIRSCANRNSSIVSTTQL